MNENEENRVIAELEQRWASRSHDREPAGQYRAAGAVGDVDARPQFETVLTGADADLQRMKAKVRGAVIQAHQYLRAGEWTEADDHILDTVTMWLISVANRGRERQNRAVVEAEKGITVITASGRRSDEPGFPPWVFATRDYLVDPDFLLRHAALVVRDVLIGRSPPSWRR